MDLIYHFHAFVRSNMYMHGCMSTEIKRNFRTEVSFDSLSGWKPAEPNFKLFTEKLEVQMKAMPHFPTREKIVMLINSLEPKISLSKSSVFVRLQDGVSPP